MQEFWKLFSAIIKEIVSDPNNISVQLVDNLKNCYWGMKEEEREICVKGILEFTGNDLELYIFLLSFLLTYCKDEKLVDIIEEYLLSDKFSLLDNLNLSMQLNGCLFANQISINREKHYRIKCKLHKKRVKEVTEQINFTAEYIPYEKRNKKRIVLMISPMLAEGHAPTRRMVNHYYFFRSLGYEVYVFATNHRWIQTKRATSWWDLRRENAIFDVSTEFRCSYYGIDVSGYHISYCDDFYLEETEAALEQILQYNPAFVMAFGDENILADLCNQFTTVITMNCINSAPVTMAPIVARYFDCTEEQKREYQEWLRPEQKIIDVKTRDVLGVEEKGRLKRADYGLTEEDFVIIIAGNRLETEVDDSFRKILSQILKENEDAVVVFIGRCPELKESLENEALTNRYKFFGAVKNFRGAIGLGDLFLNPPRVGGGTGAALALMEEVPVITLGECDVASLCGEEFVCNNLQEMPLLLRRYRTDLRFMEQQKEYCRMRTKERYSVDNIGIIQKFCKDVVSYIQATEGKCDTDGGCVED